MTLPFLLYCWLCYAIALSCVPDVFGGESEHRRSGNASAHQAEDVLAVLFEHSGWKSHELEVGPHL